MSTSSPSSDTPADIAKLYVEHHGWLRSWLHRRLGNADHAADFAQDTFLKVLTKSAQETIDEPRAYLTVVAKGLVANAYRRQQLERAYLEALAQAPDSFAPSPEERALLLEALQQIDEILDKLPSLVRKTFLLAQLEGLTYAEIADELKISPSTVKRNVALAYLQCITVMTP